MLNKRKSVGKKSKRNKKPTQKKSVKRGTKTNKRKNRRTRQRKAVPKESITINVRTSPPRRRYKKDKVKKEYFLVEDPLFSYRRTPNIHYTGFIPTVLPMVEKYSDKEKESTNVETQTVDTHDVGVQSDNNE